MLRYTTHTHTCFCIAIAQKGRCIRRQRVTNYPARVGIFAWVANCPPCCVALSNRQTKKCVWAPVVFDACQVNLRFPSHGVLSESVQTEMALGKVETRESLESTPFPRGGGGSKSVFTAPDPPPSIDEFYLSCSCLKGERAVIFRF